MKITERKLREMIGEEIKKNSLPEEFATGEDELGGYIVVYDSENHDVIASAPIMRTDGPDRPFLVRTTDTNWNVSHGIVKIIYQDVEDVFNSIDSKYNWEELNVGDTGTHGNFQWEWAESNPVNGKGE